jgi:hypothetical protein
MRQNIPHRTDSLIVCVSRSIRKHMPSLEEMGITQARFTASKVFCIQFCLVCILSRPCLKGTGRIVGQIFKLKNRGRAILSEEDYRTVIPIPAKAKVVLVGGDIDEDPFVKIRYGGRVLLMLAEDLRSGGELLGTLAEFVDK